uniref:Uncharacterized protein n=1 Tax=Arundo donax TaxID=35708 RepID=A0A0A9BCE7_ARUDO
MQPSPTGVGKHIEDVALGLGGVEAVADVQGTKRPVLLPMPLPPRLDLVVWVRPPRNRLRLTLVDAGAGAGAGAAASSEWRGTADGKEEEATAAADRRDGGRPRLELELERPLQR